MAKGYEQKTEIKMVSLLGGNSGEQVHYNTNEYFDGELIATSETTYEPITADVISKIASVVPKLHRDKALSISTLIKGNLDKLEECRSLDAEIAKKGLVIKDGSIVKAAKKK